MHKKGWEPCDCRMTGKSALPFGHSCGIVVARFAKRHAAMITIYGIKNCDTMKKARSWLDSHGSVTVSTTTRQKASIERILKSGRSEEP